METRAVFNCWNTIQGKKVFETRFLFQDEFPNTAIFCPPSPKIFRSKLLLNFLLSKKKIRLKESLAKIA